MAAFAGPKPPFRTLPFDRVTWGTFVEGGKALQILSSVAAMIIAAHKECIVEKEGRRGYVSSQHLGRYGVCIYVQD